MTWKAAGRTARRMLGGLFAVVLCVTNCFAQSAVTNPIVHPNEIHKNLVHLNEVHPTALEKLEAIGGLTFYKDFTRIAPGTYSAAGYAGLLDADFAMGSPVATFTSTDGNFTITSAGYQATTANDEVLKYLIAGNRTAATETIVIKFTPTGDFANDGVGRFLTDTDTKRRWLDKLSAGTRINSRPNSSDNSGVQADSTTTPLDGVAYVVCSSYQHASPYISVYIDGSGQATYTLGDYTTPAWGTNFYVGSDNSGTFQTNGRIAKIAFFSRPFSSSEVLATYNLMK